MYIYNFNLVSIIDSNIQNGYTIRNSLCIVSIFCLLNWVKKCRHAYQINRRRWSPGPHIYNCRIFDNEVAVGIVIDEKQKMACINLYIYYERSQVRFCTGALPAQTVNIRILQRDWVCLSHIALTITITITIPGSIYEGYNIHISWFKIPNAGIGNYKVYWSDMAELEIMYI